METSRWPADEDDDGEEILCEELIGKEFTSSQRYRSVVEEEDVQLRLVETL